MDDALKLWQEVVKHDPYYAGEIDGSLYCFFCGEWQVVVGSNEHKADCVYVRAKQLCAQASTTSE